MFCKGKQASILKHSSLKLKSLTFFMRFYLIMQLTPVFLSGKSHGQRSLAGYTVHGVTRVGHNLTPKPPPPFVEN